MDKTKIFPLVLIVLQCGAAGVYGFGGNIRMTIYWLAAAVLNIVVTF